MNHSTYNMSNDLQTTTLAAAIIVAAVMVFGAWSLIGKWRDRWSIEDVEANVDNFALDMLIGRDLHTEDRDAMRAARGRG